MRCGVVACKNRCGSVVTACLKDYPCSICVITLRDHDHAYSRVLENFAEKSELPGRVMTVASVEPLEQIIVRHAEKGTPDEIIKNE